MTQSGPQNSKYKLNLSTIPHLSEPLISPDILHVEGARLFFSRDSALRRRFFLSMPVNEACASAFCFSGGRFPVSGDTTPRAGPICE
uniref:Uncharacterized protein n=1 Tax=mine drainage metagenome TaxID=410659 RepID=E6QLC4_9ZZZZ